MNLFCFPFAGGNSYSFSQLKAFIPKNIFFKPLELPGRGTRSKEPLLFNIHEIVDDQFKILKKEFNKEYALFGHSMGAKICYLLTKKIIKHNLTPPKTLILSGSSAPSIPKDEDYNYLLPSDQFRQKLKDLGGCHPDIIKNTELMNYFEPIIKADFQSVETYKYAETEPFNVPLVILRGEQDDMTYDECLLWQKETLQNVNVNSFTGGHFFIFDHLSEIGSLISKQLLNDNS